MNSKRFGVALLPLLLLSLFVCCLLPAGASCQAPQRGTIVPGEGVAGVKLGSSLADFNAVFPKHPPLDESWTDLSRVSVFHWLDLERRANGVYACLKNDKIFQLRVQTPRFSLANGITYWSPGERVKQVYPRGQEYVLRHSGSKRVGGRDLRYWVDSGSGIAFELHWDPRLKRRFVGSIDIFPAGTEYKPEGHVASPQEWIYGGVVPDRAHSSEQLQFSAEVEGADNPVALPPGVLAMLSKDEHVRNVAEYENIPAEKAPLAWFSASAIHLSKSGKVDLVVMGEGSLRGANVTTFWVFRATPRGYELVLTAPAHDLEVKNTRWKGYRDIGLTSLTAIQVSTVLCRFDGEQYAAYKTSSESIR